MHRGFKFMTAIKNLSIPEIIVLGTLFFSFIGWVYRADSAITRGNERQAEVNTLKKEFTEFKLETSETLAEVKTLSISTDKKLDILLARTK